MPEQHDNWVHQSSFKFQDNGMHNVRSGNAKELKEELEELQSEGVIPVVLNVARQFAGLDPQANAVATVAAQMPVQSVQEVQSTPTPPGGPQNPSQSLPEPFEGMVATDKYKNTWIKDPAAPNCNCGVRALRKEGVSKQGNPYKAYKCARLFSGQGDCGFHEWVGR